MAGFVFFANSGLYGKLACNLQESLVNYSLVKYQKKTMMKKSNLFQAETGRLAID